MGAHPYLRTNYVHRCSCWELNSVWASDVSSWTRSVRSWAAMGRAWRWTGPAPPWTSWPATASLTWGCAWRTARGNRWREEGCRCCVPPSAPPFLWRCARVHGLTRASSNPSVFLHPRVESSSVCHVVKSSSVAASEIFSCWCDSGSELSSDGAEAWASFSFYVPVSDCRRGGGDCLSRFYVRFQLISWWCYGGAIVISGTISSTTAAPPVAWAIRKIKLKIKDEIKIFKHASSVLHYQIYEIDFLGKIQSC